MFFKLIRFLKESNRVDTCLMANLADIIEVLSKQAGTKKPWMTACSIAKRLGQSGLYSEEIESILLDYLRLCSKNNKKSQVRYSTLPSLKTLEVLWGHTKAVGYREACNIHKTDVADDSLGNLDEIESADVFISHSFQDYDAVMNIAHNLQASGIKPWLAETHIAKGEHINEQVISGIKEASCFVLFLSQNALQSKWTGKEFQQAMMKKIRIIVIADCSDSMIKDLIGMKFSGQAIAAEGISGNAYGFFEILLDTGNAEVENQLVSFVVYPQVHWKDFTGLAKSTHILFPFEDLPMLIKYPDSVLSL